MRTLVLMRHGKSSYPTGLTDHERPLAERGRREAKLAGQWMRRDGLNIDAVLCSTSLRTRQTLQRTGVAAPTEFIDDIYQGKVAQIFETIRVYAPAAAQTLLVIGHDPGMPDAVRALDPLSYLDRFPTSAYAVLDIGTSWDEVGLTVDSQASLRSVRVPR